MANLESRPEFVRLLLKHEPQIYAYLRAVIPHQADAEDVLQEVYLIIWEKFEQFEPGTDFAAWAMAIAHRGVLTYRKRQKRSRLHFSEELISTLTVDAQHAPREMRGLQAAFEHCLGRLAEAQRELLSRRYSAEGSVQALAEAQGQPVQTLYSRLKRTRRQLLECIQRTLAAEGNA